jgi:HAD superfamily hydrolase (TIGR01509 family)
MKRDICAVLFDMDGLLLDTESVVLECFREACTAQGLVDKEHVFYQCIGLRRADSRLVLDRELGNLIDLDRFDADWEHRIDARLSKQVPVKSGVEQVLQHLYKAGVPAVVATSTPTDIATANLKLAGLFDYMTAVLGGEQVEQGKPNPEIYLKAAGLAGCDAHECAAFEDSDPGTLAAVRSGALTVQVPDLRPPSVETLALGHLVVADLLTGARGIGLISDTH